MVPADNFCATLHVNVDNEKMSDAEFRDMVRNTLPIVEYKRPRPRRPSCTERVTDVQVLQLGGD